MTDWQITATTIYCEYVDAEVTIIVQKDGSARCVEFGKYGKPDRDTAALMKKKSSQLNRQLECIGPQCGNVTGYRDRLFAEEKNPAGSE